MFMFGLKCAAWLKRWSIASDEQRVRGARWARWVSAVSRAELSASASAMDFCSKLRELEDFFVGCRNECDQKCVIDNHEVPWKKTETREREREIDSCQAKVLVTASSLLSSIDVRKKVKAYSSLSPPWREALCIRQFWTKAVLKNTHTLLSNLLVARFWKR